ncbi:hypothetical protein MTP99_003813 [Tenebrio molitor]|nr:hypothetical protein MTP99_003813 [Tenebrio molitor]
MSIICIRGQLFSTGFAESLSSFSSLDSPSLSTDAHLDSTNTALFFMITTLSARIPKSLGGFAVKTRLVSSAVLIPGQFGAGVTSILYFVTWGVILGVAEGVTFFAAIMLYDGAVCLSGNVFATAFCLLCLYTSLGIHLRRRDWLCIPELFCLRLLDLRPRRPWKCFDGCWLRIIGVGTAFW